MKIADVVVERLTGRMPASAVALPGAEAAPDDARPIEQYYVRVRADSGLEGLYGPVDRPAAFHVADSLRPALVGMDPLAGQRVWHDLAARFRRHGRTGVLMMAISAVDCALWDLRGKHFGVPVHRLLGGPTRGRIAVYASMLGASREPARAAEQAVAAKEMGYRAQKWFFLGRPASSQSDVAANAEWAQAIRNAVGDDVELMFDAVMTWDVEFALRMARRLAACEPKWLEEPVHAGQLDGFVRIQRATGVPLAAGEHLYTRWDVKPYLEARALDFVQTDPDWTGGITELTRIAALADAHGVKLCPHGHTVTAAAHVIASQPESLCPLLEFLFCWAPRQQWFQTAPLVPRDGFVELPQEAGLGIQLDEGKIERREEMAWA